jgi:hypothetical protein
MPTFKSAEDDEEDSSSSTLSTVLSVCGFLAACGVVAVQYMTSTIWTDGTIGKLFE